MKHFQIGQRVRIVNPQRFSIHNDEIRGKVGTVVKLGIFGDTGSAVLDMGFEVPCAFQSIWNLSRTQMYVFAAECEPANAEPKSS
jgi:hypothetical protein